MILQTQRLYLRELTHDDFGELCGILQDVQVMKAYEHAFCDAEVWQWLEKQQTRYREDGFGLWAVIDRQTGAFLGQTGLTMQPCDAQRLPEIGYLFKKEYWHRGDATEAAEGCKQYAFDTLGYDAVYAIIRDNNLPSQKVAQRIGMQEWKRIVRHYYNMDMPHIVYRIAKV